MNSYFLNYSLMLFIFLKNSYLKRQLDKFI